MNCSITIEIEWAKDMLKETTVRSEMATWALLFVWAFFLVSDFSAQLTSTTFGFFVVLFGCSAFGLRRLKVHGIVLSRFTISTAFAIATAIAYSVWSNLLGAMPYLNLTSEIPLELRLAALFIPGLVSALVLSAMLIYPLYCLSEKNYWIVPVSAGIAVFLTQLSAITGEETRSFTRLLLVSELVCLTAMVPYLMRLFLTLRAFSKTKLNRA